MSEPYDQPEDLDDRAGPHVEAPMDSASDRDTLQLGQVLLEQSIEQLERLRQDYRQVHALLERLWYQLAEREAQLSRRLRDMMTLVASSRDRAPSNPGAEEPLADSFGLRVRTLGKFEVYHRGQSIPLGSSRKGRAIFRYLVTRAEGRAAKDVLLELFWPAEGPGKASHKLHIAVSTLRQALQEAIRSRLAQSESLSPQTDPVKENAGAAKELLEKDCILFEDDCYLLHPAVRIELDADEFTLHYQAGEDLEHENRVPEAMAEYSAAKNLYRGDFLPEDLYADWTIAPRARLEEMYLTLLGRLADHNLSQNHFRECISCSRLILARDSFREDAYRHLMRCYSRMGRRNQALREFTVCAQVLKQELGVRPTRETLELYERIKREEAV